MPHFGPTKRRDFIRALRAADWTGPFSGGSHEFMRKGNRDYPIPNPHAGDIGPKLLAKMLRDLGISRDEWERLP